MKHKTRRIIIISFGVLLVVAVCAWYFYPVYMYKFFFYRNDSVRKYLEITPVEIAELKPSPKEWDTISIGGLTLKLPMSRYKGVRSYYIESMGPNLGCISEMGSLLIDDIVPPKEILKLVKENKLPYPTVPYQFMLAVFKSSPADISIFNSRTKNEHASTNQILKAIGAPMYRFTKILAVNTGTIKAICTVSEKQKKGYTARAYVFNQKGTVSFTFMLKDYRETTSLESDLFGILAGIKMPDHLPDADQVDKDIKKIVAKFNKKT